MKIATKYTLIVAFFVALVLIANPIITYKYTHGITEEQIFRELDAVNYLKAKEIKEYIRDGRTALNHLSDHHIELTNTEFDDYWIPSYFDNIFIVSSNGKITWSYKGELEGKIVADQPFFLNGQSKEYLEGFSYKTFNKDQQITLSRPHENGALVGIMGADKVSNITLKRTGLGITGETYLVDKYGYSVTKLKYSTVYPMNINTQAVRDCYAQKIGHGSYTDYRNETVLGSYLWLDREKACLITEIDEAELHYDLRQIILFWTSSAIVTLAILILLIYLITKKVLLPVKIIQKATKEIAKGNYKIKLKINTKDELGELSKDIKKMVRQLKKAHKREQQHQKTLERKVKQKTKELNKKVQKLEKFKKLTIGRERKMIELKKKIKQYEKNKKK